MADNGRRPNESRDRNGRRRREPPIIDASATEVPLDAVPEEPGPAPTEPAAPPPEAAATPDPVLFGGALREPPAPAEPEGGLAPAVPDGAPAAEGLSALAGSAAAPDPVDAAAVAAPPTADEPADIPHAAVPPAARAGGGAALWLLALSNLVLLGALVWVLAAGQGRDVAALDGLRTKVAALEARPDPARIGADVANLDKRVAAADADRASLARSVAGLNTRIGEVGRQVEAASTADAGRPAPTGDAAPATAGALAALAAKVDALDSRVGTVAGDGAKTAQAVADLPKPVPPDFGPTDSKIAALGGAVDGKVAALDARLTALGGALDGTDARLNGFDAKVNAVDAKINGYDARANGIDARANGLEAKLNGDDDAIGKLRAAVDGLQPLTAATAALDGRVAEVEGQLAAPKDGARVTEARAVGGPDDGQATPVAVVGQATLRALMAGQPYGPELDALKALGAEPAAVAALAPFAASGAPTLDDLRARWDAASPGVRSAVAPPASGSALDRLAAGARALVQVREVGAAEGDDPAALVGRVGAALGRGDVPAALAAWDKLPAAGKERSADWAAAARGRDAAVAAAQGTVDRAIAALGRNRS